jgi:hypothetical protein
MKKYEGVEVHLYALVTSALMEVSGQLHAKNNLPWGKGTQISILYVDGWAPKPVSLAPTGNPGRSLATVLSC